MNGPKFKIRLQARDRKLLTGLGQLAILDRELAKIVGPFSSTTRANTRLLKLTRAGYLRRSFVGTVSSGRKAVYTLSKVGAAVTGVEGRILSLKPDQSLAASLQVSHLLKIAEFLVLLKYKISATRALSVRFTTFTKSLSQSAPIIPDAYFSIAQESRQDAFFLEVDMGTESLSSWRTKAQGYLSLALSTSKRFGVLVLLPSERRLAGVRKAVADNFKAVLLYNL